MVFGFCGSTRSWLKYIGRALQLLMSVNERPLLSERKIPPRAGLSVGTGGGVVTVVSGGTPGAPPRPPRPPRPAAGETGAPLLHQSKPPRPPPPPPPPPPGATVSV